ncbi:putative PAS PAC sensor-like protein, partial [Diplonema papillatum]
MPVRPSQRDLLKQTTARDKGSLNYFVFNSRQPRGLNLNEEPTFLFSFFRNLEISFPRQLTWAGVAIDVLQNVGFALNPRMFSWSSSGLKAVASVAYFFHLPVWDEKHLGLTYLPSAVLLWIVAVTVASLVIGGAMMAARTEEGISWFT